MKIVWNLGDIASLRESGAASGDLAEHIEELIRNLRDANGCEGDIEEFSLRDVGPVALLESSDDPRDLRALGLTRERGGIFDDRTEFVEALNFGAQTVYKIVIIVNDGYALCLFCEKGTFDDEAEAWLRSESEAFRASLEKG